LITKCVKNAFSKIFNYINTSNEQQTEQLKMLENQLKNDSRKLDDIKLALTPVENKKLKDNKQE